MEKSASFLSQFIFFDLCPPPATVYLQTQKHVNSYQICIVMAMNELGISFLEEKSGKRRVGRLFLFLAIKSIIPFLRHKAE